MERARSRRPKKQKAPSARPDSVYCVVCKGRYDATPISKEEIEDTFKILDEAGAVNNLLMVCERCKRKGS